jgi:N-acetylglucosaminyldiphosphoundecaprenol N-acetyl-beta-D-mannosaminyltransferase
MTANRNIFEAKRENSADGEANILGIRVTGSPKRVVLNIIRSRIADKALRKPLLIVTVNPEFIMAARTDGEFKNILNSADVAIADGAGLRLAGVKEIIPGRKLVAELLAGRPRTFYLGGRGGVSRKMAEKYGGEWDEGEENIKFSILNLKSSSNLKILNKINQYKPDLLLVAYGAPWQEKWIAANLNQIKAKVVMGVGGTFDYLTGRAKVPPEWVSRLGLEWLWRLGHEPWRWRRQLKLIEFAWRVIVQS